MALIRLLIAMALVGGSAHTAYAARYSTGVMERVSRNRDLPVVSCMIAMPRGKIGRWVYVWGINTKVLRYCRVTDVSAPADETRHIRMQRIEIGAANVDELCGNLGRPGECPVLVIEVKGP